MRSPSSSISALRNPRVSAERLGPKHGLHGDLGQAVADAAVAGLPLAQPDAGQLRVGEQAERHLPPGRHAVPAGEVGQHHAEVVLADVREVRAAGAVAHRPDTLGRRPEPRVDLDVPFFVRLDPRLLQADAVGVRRAPPGDEQVRPLDHAAARVEADGLAGSPLDAIERRSGSGPRSPRPGRAARSPR